MFPLFFGTLLLLSGLGGIGYATYAIHLARKSQGWPTTTGKILSADVVRGKNCSG
jgi:hypothetical protein